MEGTNQAYEKKNSRLEISQIKHLIVRADSRSYSSDLAKIRGAAPILKEIIKLCTELTFEQLKFIKHLRKCYIC